LAPSGPGARQCRFDPAHRRLWEDRFEQEQDEESLNGALYYYHHINTLLSGSDPSIVRKLSELKLKQLDLNMKPLEACLRSGEPATRGRGQAASNSPP